MWESKGLSNEKITSMIAFNYSLAPKLGHHNTRMKAEFTRSFLKPDKVTYTHGPIANICIVYKLTPYINKTSVTLENCYLEQLS